MAAELVGSTAEGAASEGEAAGTSGTAREVERVMKLGRGVAAEVSPGCCFISLVRGTAGLETTASLVATGGGAMSEDVV